MNSKGLLIGILLMLVFTDFPFGKVRQAIPPYQRLYDSAEKYYRDENADTKKDSLALNAYLKVVEMLRHNHFNDSILFNSYLKASIYYQGDGKYDKAVPLLQEALSLGDKIYSANAPQQYLPDLYLGNCYYFLNRFDSARYYYKQAETVAEKYPSIEGIERLYNTQGVMNYETG